MHAAERDHLGVGLRRLLRQTERIPHEVRHILDLGQLVVVSEDHGAALRGQRTYLGLQRRHGLEREQVHWTLSKISDKSRTGAEWVSAPIET